MSDRMYANAPLVRLSEGRLIAKTDTTGTISERVKVEQTKDTARMTAKSTSDVVLTEEEIMEDEIQLEPLACNGSEEADNTYYNTTGKRVTVMKLPEYIKDKKWEDIEEEFQVSYKSGSTCSIHR